MLKRIFLCGALLAGANAAFASGVCLQASLASLNGFSVSCGSYTYDFTNLTFINGNSGFGPNDGTNGAGDGNGGYLTASDILVTISDKINFSVTGGPGVWISDASGSEPSGVGYSTYNIEFDISIQNPYFFSAVTTQGHNLTFNAVGGEIGVNKDVIYGANNSVDVGASFDENHDPGPLVVPFVTSGLTPLIGTTQSAHIIDFVQLTALQNGNGNGVVSMDSFENTFSTPEPATLLLIGSALLGLGLVRRKTRA